MALVVMAPALGNAGHDRQDRLRSVKRLDLTLLINAQEERSLGWVHVEPHDVSDLLHEQRVLGKLPVLDSVGLKAKGPPDARDRGLREPGLLRHCPRGPVGTAVGRRALERRDDYRLDAIV